MAKLLEEDEIIRKTVTEKIAPAGIADDDRFFAPRTT
jgi:hypothetical protein